MMEKRRLRDILAPAARQGRLDMPAWLQSLVNAGIVSTDRQVRRRQRFTNIAAYALALDAIAHFAFNSFYDFRGLVPVNAYNVLVTLLYLSLHRLHRLGGNVVANALIGISLVGHSYVIFAFGLESNLHVYFTLAGFILFLVGVSHWRNFIVLYSLSVAALITVMTLAPDIGFVLPGDPGLRASLALQAMLSAVALNGLVIAYVLSALHTAERRLQQEFERSELLLTTILPATIAERLKSGRERRIADRLDGVSILFADLVGFTPAAAAADPEEVVDYLHRLFSRLDALCEEHGVDKIKTIGDAYMAVGGLRGNGDGAAAIGRLSLDMIGAARDEQLSGRALALRVGIHHGPAVAGVIGDRRMSYDVWGDTVNVASRLESSGIPGRIHVSGAYRDAAMNEFAFEPRGLVDLKGVGPQATFFLAGTGGRAARH